MLNRPSARSRTGLCAFLVGLVPAWALAGTPEIPAPPEGPHRSVRAESFGSGPRSYWLFEPIEPRPRKAPVVAFLHGWLAVNPGAYGAWIEHLTRRGLVVIFPRYQDDLVTRPDDFLPNARAAIRDGLDVLEGGPGRVRPDRERFALIGHSAGGNLAAQLAALGPESGLPTPRAVVAIMPGEVAPRAEPRLDRIPNTTLLAVVAGDQDRIVGDLRARQIFEGARAIPRTRKKYILYRSDRRGPIPLVADHLSPTAVLARFDSGEGLLRQSQMARAGVDILDRFGFWRLADLTLDAAFAGQSLDAATGGGRAFADLGHWGDGRPVTPPLVGDDLATIPRVYPTNGARLIPWQPAEFFRRLDPERPDQPKD